MFDKNIMSQLGQLKADLKANKETFKATVKGTRHRFGFAVLEQDGRELFLAPDEMDKVFNGDSITVTINTDKQGKEFAEVDSLVDSPLETFYGAIVKRGKTLFVKPDLNGLSRLIYIPPSEHKKVKPGSYVSAKINRHPINNGKAQAAIVEVIGHEDDSGIEVAYTTSKYGLTPEINDDARAEIDALSQHSIDQLAFDREDMRSLPFVTIDAASTEDMDDALYAEPTADGWKLHIAIADPSAFVSPDSALDKLAQKTMISSYLPGGFAPMLPVELTNNLCSLRPKVDRLALVASLDIDTQGEIVSQVFTLAVIHSTAKLSYQMVGHYLEDGSGDLNNEQKPLIDNLQSVALALNSFRQKHCLIMPERAEFRFQLNDKGKIESVYEVKRNAAHRLVEECMLAGNLATARYLDEHNITALHINHLGFRAEKTADIEKLASEELQQNITNIADLHAYKALLRSADNSASSLSLRPILNRSLQRSVTTTTPAPHFGLGFDRYTTFTSPIRKYSDLVNHRAIKAHLRGQQHPMIDEAFLAKLNQQISNSRQASSEIERWLSAQYMNQLVGETLTGVISHTTSTGFNVRLDDNGVIGFVSTYSKVKAERMSLDQLRWVLSNNDARYQLDQAVTVKVASIDIENRSVALEIVNEAVAKEA